MVAGGAADTSYPYGHRCYCRPQCRCRRFRQLPLPELPLLLPPLPSTVPSTIPTPLYQYAATVAVTFSGLATATENEIAVYKLTGASTTLNTQGNNTSTDMDASTPLTSGTQNVTAGNLLFVVAGGAADTSTHTVTNATADLNADAGDFRFVTATRTTTAAAAATIASTVNGSDGSMAYAIFAAGSPLSNMAGSATGTSTGAAVGTFFTSGTANSAGTSTAIAEGISDHHIQISWVELEGVEGAAGASAQAVLPAPLPLRRSVQRPKQRLQPLPGLLRQPLRVLLALPRQVPRPERALSWLLGPPRREDRVL